MTEIMPSFLETPREVTFSFHIRQVKRWLEYDAGRELDSVLVYVALELRAAIERYFFDLLLILRENDISDAEAKKCRSRRGIEALMKKSDKNYRKTLQFSVILAELTPDCPPLNSVNLAKLMRYRDDLSEFCHMQFRPENTYQSEDRSFQKRGFL